MSAKLQLLVVLLIVTITAKGETVRLEDERLTFTLPPGWVAIPEREMAQRNAELQQSLAKPYTINFKYGYQKQGADWFSYPFMLIKQQAAERMPESKLRELPTIDLSPAENKVRELFPRRFADISFGKLSYDPTTQKIWSESKATFNGTDFRALAMMEPTEKGVTAFYFYATADQYTEFKPVFLQIALSVTPDPEIVYRLGTGVTDAEGINATLRVGGFILLWLLPGIIASKRNHPKKIPIWFLTVFLGWTGIGWIPAMIWACWRIPKPKPPTDVEPLSPD